MTEEWKPKYKWRKTWDDVENDFIGLDPDTPDFFGQPTKLGRFHLGFVPGGEGWLWYVQYRPEGEAFVLPSGVAETAREAARCIEDAYEELKKL